MGGIRRSSEGTGSHGRPRPSLSLTSSAGQSYADRRMWTVGAAPIVEVSLPRHGTEERTRMLITYLGHAGFCVETSRSIIVMDPWLSPQGAFDAAWFQFPSNHHLAALVHEKLQQPKDAYVYISHEHKDHFDLAFLNSLVDRKFTLIVPHFRRPALREQLADYRCREMITVTHGQMLSLGDMRVTLYLDDSELDRDSAILVESEG